MEQREKLSSRLGFILLSAGCAIGIGNVWKFPYITGLYGGGAFVLIYLFFLVILGVPMLTVEFSIGRASQKSPLLSCKVLQKANQKWHLHGYLAMIGNYGIVMFYTTVSGWLLHYTYLMATGAFEGLNSSGVKDVFQATQANPFINLFWMIVVVLLGVAICSLGLQNGVEKITKIMMLLLLGIIVVLAVNSIFLENGVEGLKFYLLPNFESMKQIGIMETIVAAMNQAFFTLSLGIGTMAVFGSYIDRKHALFGESLRVAALDTFVAFTAGLIIFPASFAYGINADSGPNLIFVTLPNIFVHMSLGRLWGTLFFVFMSFAALSTIITVFEGIIACYSDLTNKPRKQAIVTNLFLVILLSLPCALGFNVLSNITPFGGTSTIMDLEDFIVSNIFLPLGSFIYLLFTTSKYGWGWDNFIEEANAGQGVKLPKWLRFHMTYILPLMIFAIFIYGVVTKFI